MALSATALRLAEHVRMVHSVVVPDCVTKREVLEPSYWAHVAARLRPGSRIEVAAEDGSWLMELYVVASCKVWAKVHVLHDYDLTSTALSPSPPSDDFYVKWGGANAKFRVHRLRDKTVVKDGFETAEAATLWKTEHMKAMAT